MKYSLISTVIISVGLLSSAHAAADSFMPFSTLDQAQQYCPTPKDLIFTAHTPFKSSAGIFKGFHKVAFENKKAIHPKHLDAAGNVSDMDFYQRQGIYGYISGATILCFYHYESFMGSQAFVNMMGKDTSITK